jgi:D-aminoacyl-tRNA deacylase
MRVLIQRVTRARVTVEDVVVGEIGPGMLLLAGVTHEDTQAEAELLAGKAANVRIFDDADGVMNRSALDLHAERPGSAGVLVVSQFTLYADTRKGRRPSYVAAARPEHAEAIVEHLARSVEALGLPVARGRFRAEMAVELVNDGPVTIWLDTDQLRPVR